MKIIKILFLSFFIPLLLLISSFFSSFSSAQQTPSAQNSSLIGNWKMLDLRCENGAEINLEIKKQVLAMTENAELTFTAKGDYSFIATGGPNNCTLESSGSYSIQSAALIKLNITHFNSKCPGQYKIGEQSLDYQLQGEEFLIYQPLGYLNHQLCGSESRAIQVLKQKQK